VRRNVSRADELQTSQRLAAGAQPIFARGLAQIGMLLVARVVVPHALRIADHRRVVAGYLQVFCESVRPLRGGHYASGPLAVERNQQKGRLSHRSLGLDECFDAATGSGELSQMRRHGVVNSATLRRIAALFLDPGRRPPEPTHAPIMAATLKDRGSFAA
jgi:hypothetical protein